MPAEYKGDETGVYICENCGFMGIVRGKEHVETMDTLIDIGFLNCPICNGEILKIAARREFPPVF